MKSVAKLNGTLAFNFIRNLNASGPCLRIAAAKGVPNLAGDTAARESWKKVITKKTKAITACEMCQRSSLSL